MDTTKYFTPENDALTARCSVFKSFRELVEQKNYVPTILMDTTDRFKLAELYDEYMAEADSNCRAQRFYPPMKALLPLHPDAVEEEGFKRFNNKSHLPVIVPVEGGTITCKLPDGKRITFSFIKDGHGGIECCDIHAETEVKCQAYPDREKQHVVAFSCGSKAFRSTDQNAKEVTLTTILLNDKYYGKSG